MEVTDTDVATLEMMYDNFIHGNHIIDTDFKENCKVLIRKMYRLKLEKDKIKDVETEFNTQFEVYKYITENNK